MGEKIDDANPNPGQKGGGETKPKSSPTPAAVPLATKTPESNSKLPLTRLSAVLEPR